MAIREESFLPVSPRDRFFNLVFLFVYLSFLGLFIDGVPDGDINAFGLFS